MYKKTRKNVQITHRKKETTTIICLTEHKVKEKQSHKTTIVRLKISGRRRRQQICCRFCLNFCGCVSVEIHKFICVFSYGGEMNRQTHICHSLFKYTFMHSHSHTHQSNVYNMNFVVQHIF